MEQKRWFLVPRRNNPRDQRTEQLTQPLVERVKQARVAGTTTPRSAGIKKWFEHPRRSS